MDKMLLSFIILVCHIFIFVFYFHFLFPSVPHLPVADWCFLPLMIAFDRDLSYKQSLQEKKPISGRMAHLQIATASSSSCLSFPSLQSLLCLEYTYSYTSLQGVSLSHQAGSIDLPFSGWSCSRTPSGAIHELGEQEDVYAFAEGAQSLWMTLWSVSSHQKVAVWFIFFLIASL